MRRYFIAATLAVSVAVAVAQDDPFKQGDDLKTQVAKECADGCIVFSRERAAEFEERLGKLIGKRELEAYKAGMEYQKQACASLI
jgi:hypothetical protein